MKTKWRQTEVTIGNRVVSLSPCCVTIMLSYYVYKNVSLNYSIYCICWHYNIKCLCLVWVSVQLCDILTWPTHTSCYIYAFNFLCENTFIKNKIFGLLSSSPFHSLLNISVYKIIKKLTDCILKLHISVSISINCVSKI